MRFFDRAYEGTPPWEIGRAQGEFVRLEDEGEIRGRVLDVGCGTGENALFFATRGHDTWGIDFAPKAVRRAREKANGRNVTARFERASALELDRLGERFDTVTDCGIFHTFPDEDRPVYAASVASVLRPRGRLFILCFSEKEPTDWGGPRRVTEAELRATFADGWRVRWLREARFETNMPRVSGLAWLTALERSKTGPGARARRVPPSARPTSPRKTRGGGRRA